ncbi:hypothetical protein E2C01_075831 [Portunus trituberculatus]|uniref:Uncharacterized protein n=1 Tax=Portunus trituberculatus TaxID=210409 RepID=A0A5B7ILJ9_PORTR|nr:hypothetical protein [Portunus trituberculatus]
MLQLRGVRGRTLYTPPAFPPRPE